MDRRERIKKNIQKKNSKRGKKRNNRSEENSKEGNSKEKNSLDSFTLNEVHIHYTCHCSVLPTISLNQEKGIFQVPVGENCPKCHKGKCIEVVLGEHSVEMDGKCPDPMCLCEEVTMMIPVSQFMYLLKESS